LNEKIEHAPRIVKINKKVVLMISLFLLFDIIWAGTIMTVVTMAQRGYL